MLLIRRGNWHLLRDGEEDSPWGPRSARGGLPYSGVWPEYARYRDSKGPRIGRWHPAPALEDGVIRPLTETELELLKTHPPGPGGLLPYNGEEPPRADWLSWRNPTFGEDVVAPSEAQETEE